MKVQRTYTLIITRNFGHPISLSVSAWRLYGVLALAAILLAALTVLSVLSLTAYPRLRALEQRHEQLLQEREQLQEQLHSRNQERYTGKEQALLVGSDSGDDDDDELSRLAGAARYPSEEAYLPPIKFTSVAARVGATSVEVIFQLAREGDALRNRGGFLFAIFENRDVDPALFHPTPSVDTNDNGFPEAYKAGIRVTRVRSAITIRRRIRRESPEEYFTHVTLYLFSIRGGLLIRDRFELEREMFLNPDRKTHKLT